MITIGVWERTNRNKGNFIDIPLNEYVAFDLETTGLSPEFDEIIEITAIKVRNSIAVDKYTSLIKPKSPVSVFITELTGITNEMLENQPSIEEIIDEVYDFIGECILLGHNIHFDLNFLYDELLRIKCVELNNDYIDLLRVSRKVFSEFSSHTLSYLSEKLKPETMPSHRAENDAIATYQIYEICKKHVLDNNIDYTSLFKRKYLTPSDIIRSDNSIMNNIFNNEEFVFTGKLDKMERKKAWQLVVNNGGLISNAVSKKTSYLVLGNLDYSSQIKNGKSNKLKKAEHLILQGYDLKIISENVFYDMIDYVYE